MKKKKKKNGRRKKNRRSKSEQKVYNFPLFYSLFVFNFFFFCFLEAKSWFCKTKLFYKIEINEGCLDE